MSIVVLCRRAAILLAAIYCAFTAVNSSVAKPRPPAPPFPERQLRDWRFDDPNWIARPTSNALAAENLLLAESWSGYALDMSGAQSSLLALPLLSGTTKPNIAANAGTIRFWFAPYWRSVSAGGTGPGDWVRLLDIGNPADALERFWITLALDPTGNLLTLAAKSDGQPLLYLQAATAQWQPNAWHQIAIVYSPSNTLLVVDGAVAATTETRLPWPTSAEWPQVAFALGSGLDGQDIAQGQLEELTTFAFPLSVEYLAWHYQQFAPIAAMGPISAQSGSMMMTADSAPPVPGPGGGGGSGGGVTNPPSPPGLKLTKPVISGAVLATTLAEADTNSAYDIFQKLGLQPTNTWSRVAVGDIGQTNFSLSVPSTNHAFYMAAAVVDSDFDGLPDSFEELVLHTSPLLADTNGDGVPDGNGDVNGNGLPDYVDYNGLTRAIVYTTRANAYEGGLAGEVTIRLPSSAPTNNTKVTLHLGGNTDYDGDYWLAKLDGTRVTNDVSFVIGEREIRLQVHASNDTVQASVPRRVSISLDSSANYQLDPQRADVTLIDNDLPTVSLVAPDAKAGEPQGTNVNPGTFVIRREGTTTNALTVLLSVGGGATAGTDYTNFSSPVVIPIGSNVVTIPINPIHDTNYEGDENVILTLQTSASYVIETNVNSATIALADNDLPLVYFVGTDLVATEYNSLKAATVTLRRTGNTSQPLTVPLAISGTATTNVDYQSLANSITFAANSSNAVINVQPLADAVEEAAETVILVIKGSVSYNIGASNAVTVHIDDDWPTRYIVAQPLVKESSTYDPARGVDSPALIDIHRYGRSSQAVNYPFLVTTNAGGRRPSSFYRVYGDVSGTNAVFASFASRARLKFTAPVAVSQGGGFSEVQFPNLPGEYSNYVYAVWYQPTWQALSFSIIETNVIEGGVQGRVRVSRAVTGPVAMTVGIRVSGQAIPAGFANADHTLGSELYINLPANALSADATFTASTDSTLEGWENMVFTPMQTSVDIGFDPRSYMGFVRENNANPEFLPQGDYDIDGLPDRWELAHGLDPFNKGDEALDPDSDGLVNADEFGFNTNPKSDDSDGDGEKDFAEANRIGDPEEFLAIRLVTRDTGKVTQGNCAVCHTTQLRVGEFSHLSQIPGELSERTVYFRKGTNYPINLSRIVRALPPPPNNGNPPLTTATYTAGIVPEGNAPRAFIVQDTQARLGTNKPPSSFPADPGVAIGTLTVPKIDVIWTNISGDLPLDVNTNAGGGLRIFPDALSPNDFVIRNRPRVKIQTTPPLSGQRVLLRSFDVDDPFVHPHYSATDTDPNDAGGEKGDDNLGIPSAGQLASTTVILDSQGVGTIDYAVTFQPGNNFRVAAVLDTPGAQAHLDELQVTNRSQPLYVTADTNAIPGFVGGISPMLTVWRKLHVEFDTMAAPPASGPEANYIVGAVNWFRPNYPTVGQSLLRVRHEGGSSEKGLFEHGKIEITGVGTFAVTNSSTFVDVNDRAHTVLVLTNNPTGIQTNQAVKLYDDDDHYLANDPLYPSLLTLQSPPVPALHHVAACLATNAPRFADAYIVLVDANAQGFSTPTTIAFKRQASLGFFDVGNQQLKGKDRPEFWAYTVVFGYELGPSEDGDPDSEDGTLGFTQKSLGGILHSHSAIYLETLRDEVFERVPPESFTLTSSTNALRAGYLDQIYATVAHEIGHAPAGGFFRAWLDLDHKEGGLMSQGLKHSALMFSAKTIKRFRGTTQWTR